MGPRPASPIPSHTPAQRPLTPPRVSVGISPICVQHTPPRTVMSGGCLPAPLFDLLPPDLAAFFNSTQMQSTQHSPVHSPTRLADPDIVSVTSCESDNEAPSPSLKRTTRARSPDIVPETQAVNGFVVDPLVCPHSVITYDFLTHFPDGPDVVEGSRVEAQEVVYSPGSIINTLYFFFGASFVHMLRHLSIKNVQ